jgi:branched-chain amino acid transport system substrate-binding protein
MRRFLSALGLTFLILTGVGCGQTSSDKIQIGVLMTLTGSGAVTGGQAQVDAMQLAVDEINQTGGINGRELELVVEDSQTSSEKGIEAYQNLISFYHPSVIINSMSSLSMALAPLAKENQIPHLVIYALSRDITKQNEWMFRYGQLGIDEIEAIRGLLVEKKIKKIGVLYSNEDYGQSFVKNLGDIEGLQVVSEAVEMASSDVRTQLTKLIQEKPDAIYIVGYPNHVTAAINVLAEQDLQNIIVLANNTVVFPNLRQNYTGLSFLIYSAAPSNYRRLDEERVKEFYTKYRKKTGVEPDHNTLQAYDSIYLVAQVMKEQGTTPAEVQKGLSQLSSFEGLLGPVKIDGRDFRFPMYPVVIEHGEIKYL